MHNFLSRRELIENKRKLWNIALARFSLRKVIYQPNNYSQYIVVGKFFLGWCHAYLTNYEIIVMWEQGPANACEPLEWSEYFMTQKSSIITNISSTNLILLYLILSYLHYIHLPNIKIHPLQKISFPLNATPSLVLRSCRSQ